MRNMSVTVKIALWYAAALVLITGLFVAVIVNFEHMHASNAVNTQIMDEVEDAMGKIAKEGKDFTLSRETDYYDDGVYISVYDNNGVLVEGKIPHEISSLPEFHEEKTTEMKGSDGEIWYVYDRTFEIEGTSFQIRGAAKAFYENSAAFTRKIGLMILPLLVAVAIAGGALITRKIVRPVRRMMETVEEIRESKDYSKRVEVEGKHDEMHELASSFNSLFDDVEESFEKEKKLNSDLAHELKTPLAVLISQSDYAIENPDYSEKALATINSESRRMAEMVSSMLTLARSDAGTLVLENNRVDLSELCEIIAEQQSIIASEKGINFCQSIEEGITVQGDEVMLMRAILNYTDNAMKYGAAENGTVALKLERSGDEIIISVTDSGKGISKEEEDKIWDRFYRGDQSRCDSDSAGLGLSMVKAIAEAHGGKADVSGSTFRIILPADTKEV